MKVKFLLLICLFVTCANSTIAKKRNIYFSHEWIGKAKHSKAILPIVSHDGNILYIESKNCIPHIEISVNNVETGNVVYENVACINGEISFFTNLNEGLYEIEMTIGDKTYVGQFEIGDEYEDECDIIE